MYRQSGFFHASTLAATPYHDRERPRTDACRRYQPPCKECSNDNQSSQSDAAETTAAAKDRTWHDASRGVDCGPPDHDVLPRHFNYTLKWFSIIRSSSMIRRRTCLTGNPPAFHLAVSRQDLAGGAPAWEVRRRCQRGSGGILAAAACFTPDRWASLDDTMGFQTSAATGSIERR